MLVSRHAVCDPNTFSSDRPKIELPDSPSLDDFGSLKTFSKRESFYEFEA
jgi:hypothetical protein